MLFIFLGFYKEKSMCIVNEHFELYLQVHLGEHFHAIDSPTFSTTTVSIWSSMLKCDPCLMTDQYMPSI